MGSNLVVGLFAHVDAGKTTLGEAMLYTCGNIRFLGRVDHGDSHLDVDCIERDRGITIESKQAVVEHAGTRLVLLDTPGHVDFAGEAQRVLPVVDCAVVVVSGPAGVQPHTETLWHLLERAGVPTFVFVNKMDLEGADVERTMGELRLRLGESCFDFTAPLVGPALEELATSDEAALEEYLATGGLCARTLARLVGQRRVFPCFMGSALRLEGVRELLDGLVAFGPRRVWPEDFQALVYKVSHDQQGTRLTWLKVLGGQLRVKQAVCEASSPEETQKVDQIRVYSGARHALVDTLAAGEVAAATGLEHVRAGSRLVFPGQRGSTEQPASKRPALQPVLSYAVEPGANDVRRVLAALAELGDEEPLLGVRWDERLGEIRVQLMGTVQLEVVRRRLLERYGLDVSFGPGGIAYRETIAAPVVGIGHFEPLRHYAEAHVLIEPLECGAGLEFGSACSLDDLDRNWQRLMLTNAMEREHLGVLVGAPLTDVRITLIAGATHPKHTQGGDCRQAVYRAIRQGLMQARSVLLEPWYAFVLEVPQELIGRAISDVQAMGGSFGAPSTVGANAVLEGMAPAAGMQDYALEVVTYTRGRGRLRCELAGYLPCHNAEEVVAAAAYDPLADLPNTPNSVFCSHGAGYVVRWDEVAAHAHVDVGSLVRAPWRACDASFFSSGA